MYFKKMMNTHVIYEYSSFFKYIKTTRITVKLVIFVGKIFNVCYIMRKKII